MPEVRVGYETLAGTKFCNNRLVWLKDRNEKFRKKMAEIESKGGAGQGQLEVVFLL